MRDKQIMLVNLYKALGGGWDYEPMTIKTKTAKEKAQQQEKTE